MEHELEMDIMGNAVIKAGATKAEKLVKQSSKKASGKNKKKNDYNVAIQAVEQWGKPLAWHAGELWSFTPERGWEVVTTSMLALCNKLRGCNTENSVFKVLTNQLATPSMEHVQEATTYLRRVGGVWDGHWEPYHVTANEVVFADGVLNLDTPEFTRMPDSIIFGPRVTVPFGGMDVRCKEFEELVTYAIPDNVERAYFQKICSLILQPHVVLRGQIVLWGTKHSGKTTLATAIACAPAGLVGSTFVTEDRLVHDKFASTPLINKFANVSNDSEFTSKWEAFMKSYTSGTMVVEPKFHKSVSLPVTAKIISTCNEMQRLKDLSGAAEQRYKVFEFRKPIADTGRTDQTERMTPTYWCKPERRAGIICWLLQGLRRALVEGISEPAELIAKKKTALAGNDPVYAWVYDAFEAVPGAFIASDDIINKIPVDELGNAATPQKVLPMLGRIWGAVRSRQKGVRGYSGIRFKE